MLAQLSQFPQSQWSCLNLFDKPCDIPMPCPTPTCTPEPNSSLCPTLHPPDPHLASCSQIRLSSALTWELAARESGLLAFQRLRRVVGGPGSPEFRGQRLPLQQFPRDSSLAHCPTYQNVSHSEAFLQAEQHTGLVEAWEGRCSEASRAFSCASAPHGDPPQILSTPHPPGPRPDAGLLQLWDVCCYCYH